VSSGYPSIPVIDDDAHGLLGAYPGKALGSIGAPGTLSIHETKDFICGESGALVLNDHALRDRAEIIRQKGTNRAQFSRTGRQVQLGRSRVELRAVSCRRSSSVRPSSCT
jgi:dTDP-4-amino-4,6-dideoxygalactose transaminase